MKRIFRVKMTLLPLILTATICFCSCGVREQLQKTTEPTAAETVAAFRDQIPETTAQPEETTTQQPEPTTEQSAATTRRAAAKATTKRAVPDERDADKPVTVTGVETRKANGKTVIYPIEVEKMNRRWPVISWANGTGCPTWSYTALLEALAYGGYIVIADDDVMTADGSTQRDSIDYILRQNDDPSSVFYQKIDPAAIGVCGHSQGGRSCFNAAKADGRVRCLVSIAGSPFVEEARGVRVPSLILTGTSDLIVVSSQWCKPSFDAVEGRAVYASLKGAVHTTCMTHPEKVSGYVLSWFDACLKHDAKAKQVFQDGGRLACDEAWQDFQSKNG